MQVAADLLDAFADGVWLVEFASLFDPALVAQAVASIFDIHDQTARPQRQVLIEVLQPREVLLVLDNCEHLIVACARLAAMLLQACPNLHILATSREALNIPGESIWLVPPLSTLDPKPARISDAQRPSEAAQLFIQRATLAQPTFAITDHLTTIARICQQLDGLPLAIELAAARVRALSVEQIATRLDDQLTLLNLGSRIAPARHQTLRATIDWSYDLLTADEQILFRRLAVFAGGWALEVAEAVCSSNELTRAHVLNTLSRLVEKSLILAREDTGTTRYRMLETIRQYAGEKLLESGEAPTIRNRHLDYFVEWVELADQELHSPQQRAWLDRLDADYANLRTAAEWAEERRQTEAPDEERGLRLVGALYYYWHVRSHLNEARRWANTALAGTSSRTLTRARALRVSGTLDNWQQDTAAGRPKIEESAAIYREWGEAGRWGVARALMILGNFAWQLGDPAWQEYYKESLALWRTVGKAWEIANVLNNMGSLATERGDYDAARSLLDEGVALARESGDPFVIGVTLESYGELLASQGDKTAARAYLAECLKVYQSIGHGANASRQLRSLAEALSDQPASLLHAARLWGASTAQNMRHGDVFPDQLATERAMAAARVRLGEIVFDTAWAEGQVMTLTEAIDYALAVLEASPAAEPEVVLSRQTARQLFGGLTAREREVAVLVAQGKSNRDIAAELVVSEHTVATHVSHILSKLEFDTRAQVAGWVVEKGLAKPPPD
ncbi:MAG: tetratricopeptide repeat protein [Chloroflexi bacterium]|nr:tetratricopeptide repeat protein [Chloroflexota bacterium]